MDNNIFLFDEVNYTVEFDGENHEGNICIIYILQSSIFGKYYDEYGWALPDTGFSPLKRKASSAQD